MKQCEKDAARGTEKPSQSQATENVKEKIVPLGLAMREVEREKERVAP